MAKQTIRGVTLEDKYYLYDWDADKVQLTILHSDAKNSVGKELFQALQKNIKDKKSEVKVMTQKQINKTLASIKQAAKQVA